ncbi:neuraminidase-like domain-containing protein [Pseudorhodoferax sp.]|uniref:Tc toxin subunit A-related protein n=1 Tax=Pseudorhodoferax sp. TaxID=1993553 RepID=UPI002DD666F7|nr:neuraminidase-like domain-containing protein [Pseudorhodoferax sp.]
MPKVVTPLKLHMKRPAVADLQRALAARGFPVGAAEAAAGRFGATTRQAVAAYQARHGLQASGSVDAPTARHLNRALPPDQAGDGPTAWMVLGQVAQADGTPAAGVTVRAYDQDVANATLLGEAVTDAGGRYVIGFAESDFRRSPAERGGPDLFVQVQAADGSLLGRSAVQGNAPAECRIDLQVGPGQFRVWGRVVQADGAPAAGLTVTALDRDLRQAQTLGTGTTDPTGRYEILYTRDQFVRADKASADLVLQVFDPLPGAPAGGGALRAESDVLFNAPVDAEVDLVVPDSGSGPCEFDRLAAAVAPLLDGQGVALAALTDADLDFLAGETAIARQQLAWLALAHARARETAPPALDGGGRFLAARQAPLLGPEAFYAWFQQGLPTDLDALLDQGSAALQQAWQVAADQRVVPPPTAAGAVLDEQLAQLRAHRDLAATGQPGRASIGDLLATLPARRRPVDRDCLVFARLHRRVGATPQLWAQAEAAGLGDRLPDLQRTLALDALTGGHLPLIAALQAPAQDSAAPGALEGLAALTRADWVDLAYAHGVPAGAGLAPADYARQLAGAVEQRHPTAVLRARLRDGTLRIAGLPSAATLQLLDAHPDLALRADHIDQLLARPGADGADSGERAGLCAGLRRLARVLPLTGALDATAVLLDQGFDSAHTIARTSLAVLADRCGGQIAPDTLRAIRNTAQGVAATHLALAARLSPRFNPQATPMLPFAQANPAWLAQSPNLRALFGDLDSCACRHGDSVLGPAAYLVDLLNFVDSWDAGNLGGALWLLRQRRPDLWDLDLSCDNTDTEIPAIDLVLEVLENAVALPQVLAIGAHGGTDIADALAQGSVPPAVRATLARTATTLGDALTVTACPPPPAPHADTLRTWRIEDGARCWQVIHAPGLLWADFGVVGPWLDLGPATARVLDAATWDTAHAAFASGALPTDMAAAVAARLGLPLQGAPVVSPIAVPPEVLAQQGLQRELLAYAVQLTLAAGVAIDAAAGTVSMLDADGSLLRQVPARGRFSARLLAAIRAWLDDPGAVDPVVVELLQLPPLAYTRTANPEAGQWTISAVAVWRFVLVREALAVLSLSYRNSSVRSQLAAAPENRNPLAYEVLRSCAYPWALPLDLPTEEVRAFLADLGVPRVALMALLRPAGRVPAGEVDEWLGLTSADRALIVPPTGAGAPPAAPWALWGLQRSGNLVADRSAGLTRSGDWPAVLTPVSLLLQQAGLQHRELLDLLATGFGGATPPQIELTDLEDACRTSKMRLQGLGEVQLDWIHRFTRLWRRTGDSMRVLDRSLQALGGLIDAEALRGLALLRRLQGRLAQPPLALLALLGHLETRPWVDHLLDGTPCLPSLFDTTFQPHALQRSTSFALFRLAADGRELACRSAPGAAADPLPLRPHAPFIAAALGLPVAGIEALVAAGAAAGLADALTLANLATLHGLATLCRSLHLDASALLRWQGVLGMAPFTPAPPAERADRLLAFIARFDSAAATGLSLDTWDYLLRHSLQGPFADAEDRLRAGLDTLRGALRTGQALGNPSTENLVVQLGRCGVPAPALAAVSSAAGLQQTLRAQLALPAPLRPAPQIPASLAGRVDYTEADAGAAAWLTCRGPMADGDFQTLATVVDAALVQELAQRHGLVHALLVAQLRHGRAASLAAALPPGTAVPLPDDLAPFLRCTPAPALALDGLLDAAQADVALQAIRRHQSALAAPQLAALAQALAALVAQSAPLLQGPPAGLIDPATACALLAAPTQADTDAALLQLVPRVDADLLAATLGPLVTLNQRLVAALLANGQVRAADGRLRPLRDLLAAVAGPAPDAATAADALRAMLQLDKTARLIGGADLSAAELQLLQRPVFDILRFDDLPTAAGAPPAAFVAWQALQALLRVRAAVPGGSATLLRLADRLDGARPALPDTGRRPATEVDGLGGHLGGRPGGALGRAPGGPGPLPPPHQPDGLDLLAEVFQLPRAQVETACSAALLDLPWRDGFRRPDQLQALVHLLQFAQRLGTDVQTLAALATAAPGEPAATLARQLFMAQCDADSLPQRLAPISDRLRRRQRDALVSHLTARDHLAGGDDLLDRYLIDVQLEPCLRTSRLRQAISAVQLFVQRCLLRLEGAAVDPARIDARQWEWMKNYRVWEANRKVFLYPENWIEPELRDDKSPLFRQLESDLTQENLTLASAMDAFRGYLERAARLAQLQVVAVCDQRSPGRVAVDIVAREPAAPARHHVRHLSMGLPLDAAAGIDWTPWEAIDGEVGGDHVLAFRLIGLLHLACLRTEVAESGRDWKLKLEVRRRERQAWVAAKEDTTPLLWPMPPFLDAPRAFLLKAQPQAGDADALAIDCYAAGLGDAIRDAATAGLVIKTTLSSGQRTQLLSGQVRALNKRVDIRGNPFFQTCSDPRDGLLATVYGFGSMGAYIGTRRGAGGVLAFDGRSIASQFTDLSPVKGGTAVQMQVLIVTATVHVLTQTHTQSRVFVVDAKMHEGVLAYDFVFELEAMELVIPDAPETLQKIGTYRIGQDLSIAFERQDPKTAPTCTPPADWFFTHSGLGSSRLAGPDHPLRVVPGWDATQPTSDRQFVALRDGDQNLSLLRGSLGQYHVVPSGQDWIFSGVRRFALQDAFLPDFSALPDTAWRPGAAAAPAITLHTGAALAVDLQASAQDLRITFDRSQPAGLYDWEVFFHAPLMLAVQLGRAQRFAEAQRMFHTIFNPTSTEDGSEAVRYWRFEPFRAEARQNFGDTIAQTLADFARGRRPDLADSIAAWRRNPFNPHLVARFRVRAYLWVTVTKYIDNLLAWGDQLFRRDTIESINEATQLYVLAARILGPRPQSVPRPPRRPHSYGDLRGRWDAFSNAWIALEDMLGPWPGDAGGLGDLSQLSMPVGQLYFCVPPNDAITALWDAVDDRLFKIRHCMNIDGVARQLPLFDPPIDPALLVRAVAAGVDIASALADQAAPLPHYRFQVMLQQAKDLCAELKALGGGLLSALEKKDAEALAQQRSAQELGLLRLTRQIRAAQIDEARSQHAGLLASRQAAEARYKFYGLLQGKGEPEVPKRDERPALEPIPLSLATSLRDASVTGLGISRTEESQLRSMDDAHTAALAAGVLHAMAGIAFAVGSFPLAAPVASALGQGISAMAGIFSELSADSAATGQRHAIVGSYERRRSDWVFQGNMALRELQQIDRQLAGADIRIAIAEKELAQMDRQIENAGQVDDFLRSKFTNQDLHAWMGGQIGSLYFQTYQLAHQLAKRAQRCFEFELGTGDSGFIQFGHWDSLKKGLLAGERLHHDLRRMEAAFHERNQRDYEITKQVSLAQLDPLALVALRQTGRCEFTVPERAFDLDCPGHYLRRIKTVGLSIPCVTGPYTGVHCKLTLLSSAVRVRTGGADHGEPAVDDPRFLFDHRGIQSVVTSTALADSGTFETGLHDERYLPFEGAGAHSTWRLELPDEIRQFNYDTISDIVMELRYTAREGGEPLRSKAVRACQTALAAAAASGSVRLFSVRREFPNAWAAFMAADTSKGPAQIRVHARTEHFPAWLTGTARRRTTLEVERAILIAQPAADAPPGPWCVLGSPTNNASATVTLQPNPALGGLPSCDLREQALVGIDPFGEIALYFDSNRLDDLWLAISVSAAAK